MAKFSDVFSTTAKVVLALLILSILCGIGYGILAGIGTVVTNPGKTTSGSVASSTSTMYDAADNFRSTIPKSVWDKGMERAVKKHCFIQGMSKEEVQRALGDPTTKASGAPSSWTYQLPTGKCLRYDGDTCIEKEKHEQIVFFTPKGNVSIGVGCETLKGSWAYNQSADLFKNLPPSRAKVSEQVKPCKYADAPDQFCWDPHDGNGERGPYLTREIAIREAMRHYE